MWFALEMAKAEMVEKLISFKYKVSNQQYFSKSKSEKIKMIKSITNLFKKDDSGLLLIDDNTFDSKGIINKIRKQYKKNGVDIIYIDYFQLMNCEDGKTFGNANSEYEEISKRLKRLSKNLSIPIVLIVQLNNKEISKHQDVLKKDEFFQTENIIEKRRRLLFHQSLVPYEKKDKQGNKVLNGRAICLNFDLDKKEIEFKLSDKELIEENREYFFAFRLGAPKDKKKFLSTNNLDTFYSAIFSETLLYIQDKRNNNRSREWFKNNITNKYEEFISMIFGKFYVNGELLVQKGNKKIEGNYLNYEQLKENQKKLFISIMNEFGESNKKITINELYNRFLNKLFFDSDSKNISNFPPRFIVLFNNQNILEYNDGEHKNDYINLC
jgi:phosphopantetheine adenylyltransferase